MPKILVGVVSIDKDVIDLLHDEDIVKIAGIFDNKPMGTMVLGCTILGDDAEWETCKSQTPALRVVIAVDQPERRHALVRHYGSENLYTLVARTAYVSASARIGLGSIVQRGCTVSADSSIGGVCKLNIGATVHHDCAVGDYSTLAPGSRLLGNVRLGSEVYVGASATILPGVSVGPRAVIGAGAVVIRDVPAGATIVGVPGSPIGAKDDRVD